MRADAVRGLHLRLHLLLEAVELRLVAYQVEPIGDAWRRGVYRVAHVRVRGFAASLREGVVSVPFGALGWLVRVEVRRDAAARDSRLGLVKALAY